MDYKKVKQSRQGQVAVDSHVLRQDRMKKAQQQSYKYNGVEGVEELMEKGNMQEAALVASQEGLKNLTHMFMNSFESMLERKMSASVEAKFDEAALEAMMERVIDRKIEAVTEVLIQRFDSMFIESQSKKEFVGHFKADKVSEKRTPQPDDFEIPRTNRGGNNRINWREVERNEMLSRVIVRLMAEAEQELGDGYKKGVNVKGLSADHNGMFQRLSKLYGKGAWAKTLAQYEQYKQQA